MVFELIFYGCLYYQNGLKRGHNVKSNEVLLMPIGKTSLYKLAKTGIGKYIQSVMTSVF